MIRHFFGQTLLLITCFFSIGLTEARSQNAIYRYTHMGNQRFHRNQTDAATTYYLKVLSKDASNSRAMFNLANVYLTKGNVHAADSLYNRVTQLERNPQMRAMAWHNRGYISQTAALHSREQQQQLLRQAIEHYKQSLRLNPHSDLTRYNLALCQKQLKNSPQSQQQQKQQQQQKKQNKQQDNKQQQNNKQQQQQNQQQQNQQQQDRQQTEQYMNLARQAERRALERLKKQQPRQRSLEKNW